MSISEGKFSDIKPFRERNGVVTFACGGSIDKYWDDLIEYWVGEGMVAKDGRDFSRSEAFWVKTSGGRVDLVMPFAEDGYSDEFDMGRFAMWRLQMRMSPSGIHCSWLDDYIDNYEDQH